VENAGVKTSPRFCRGGKSGSGNIDELAAMETAGVEMRACSKLQYRE